VDRARVRIVLPLGILRRTTEEKVLGVALDLGRAGLDLAVVLDPVHLVLGRVPAVLVPVQVAAGMMEAKAAIAAKTIPAATTTVAILRSS
jgi:hypothetical protein